MFLAKLKLTVVAVLTILTAGLGAGLLTHQGLADQPAQPKSQEAAKPVAQPDNPPSDKDKLQGTWMLIARDEDGKRRDFPQGVGILLIVDGNKLTTREDPVGLFAHGSGSVSESSYALRPKDDPKGIDLLYLNGPKKDHPWNHGIYSLEGQHLKICSGGEENHPPKFDTH